MSTTELVVDALAVYRLARLVTTDHLLHGPRERVVHAAYAADGSLHDGPPAALPVELAATMGHDGWAALARHDGPLAPKLAQLATCRWCASVWVALGVVAARRVAPSWWGPVAKALAASAVAGMLAQVEVD